jgi:transcriptional regulator with XRE-family HTH domain
LTQQELQVAQKIATLMRAARKRQGLTQITVSQRLGISQSALSKVESALLIPSAPQWFEFCEMTGIAADSLTTGLIESHRPATLQQSDLDVGYKLNNKYRDNRGSKVRATLPFVAYFRSIYGDQGFDDWMKYIKVDSDMFVDLDTQVNLNFCLDIARELTQRGLLKAKDFPKLVKTVSQPQTHGSVHRFYDGNNSLNLLTVLIQNSKQYECNFQYKIEDHKKDQIEISVTPEKHLKSFAYKDDPVLGDFLCKYKQHYFERFATYGGAAGAELREGQCHYKGADRCVYHLKMAS